MKVILLCASIETELEQNLNNGIPKALLPLNSISMLDHWYTAFTSQREKASTSIYIVSSGLHYKYFERWATSKGIPVKQVINNGITSKKNRLGASRDLVKGLIRAGLTSTSSSEEEEEKRCMEEDVLVVGGESIFYQGFGTSSR